MNRLRLPPTYLVLRVLALCLAFALLLLWTGGGSFMDAVSMADGSLRLLPDGTNALHALLSRSVKSFFLVLLALVIAMSFALALALVVSHAGGRVMRVAGWLGRALAGVPPMGWAMGGVVLLLRGWHLPVETLFPHQTPPDLDSVFMRVGRGIWAWLAPALALSLPVFGTAFFSLTHRLSALLESHGSTTLRARGISRSSIIHRHFAPLLGVQMSRLARPAAVLLLCFDIPVEEIFGFHGWGHFVATQLVTNEPQTFALATAMWVGGWMLAGLLAVAGWADRRDLPPSLEEVNDHGQRLSLLSTAMGVTILLLLMVLPTSSEQTTPWEQLMVTHGYWWGEIPRALIATLLAFVFVMLGVPFLLPSLRSRWLAGGGVISSVGLAPLFLMLLLWDHVHARSWLGVAVVLAAPGLGALRAFFLDETHSGFLEASRALGEDTFGLCYRHLLRLALPGLLNWWLRTAGTALILFSVLDFYDPSLQAGTHASWGAAMRAHQTDLLEHPGLALGPALWIALWSLSFRLLSRAFHTDTPQRRTPTFAP
jgi:ABC-type dipeptide/oligopeptide/nickel transport system permease component